MDRLKVLETSATQILKESSGNGLGFENGPNKVVYKKCRSRDTCPASKLATNELTIYDNLRIFWNKIARSVWNL